MTSDAQEITEETEETTVVVSIGTPVKVVAVNFFREEIEALCGFEIDEDTDCDKKSVYVHPSDPNDTLCAIHRMEISPRRKKEFILIEDVPSNAITPDERLAQVFAEDEELNPEDFVIKDEADTARFAL